MGEFHLSDCRRHQSPTARLIAHKNCTVKHKKVLTTSARSLPAHLQKSKTSQFYTTAPGQSYFVEAEGGELNYDMAHTNPKKFYKQVMKQNLYKH